MAEVPDTISIKKGSSSATVHLFGATLISWKPKGVEALFVSQNTHMDNERPIRGGVPVIFPQFGPWENGPQHGFVRRTEWSLKEGSDEKVSSAKTTQNANDSDTATFILEDSEATRKLWNYKFKFEYTLSLASDSELKMDAVITNTDIKSFDFTFLLHTYFSVPDVTDCTITGLNGCSYIDKVKSGQLGEETNEEVKISNFTDKIYQKTPPEIKINRASANRNISIKKTNLPDTVVWNPWADNAKKMEDFGDEEWKQMICVEAGYVSEPCTLPSGQKFVASQVLSVV